MRQARSRTPRNRAQRSALRTALKRVRQATGAAAAQAYAVAARLVHRAARLALEGALLLELFVGSLGRGSGGQQRIGNRGLKLSAARALGRRRRVLVVLGHRLDERQLVLRPDLLGLRRRLALR